VPAGSAASAASPGAPVDETPSTCQTVDASDWNVAVVSSVPENVRISATNVLIAVSALTSVPTASRGFGTAGSTCIANDGSTVTAFDPRSAVTDWFRSKSNSSSLCRLNGAISRFVPKSIGRTRVPVNGLPATSRIVAGALWPTRLQTEFVKSSVISASTYVPAGTFPTDRIWLDSVSVARSTVAGVVSTSTIAPPSFRSRTWVTSTVNDSTSSDAVSVIANVSVGSAPPLPPPPPPQAGRIELAARHDATRKRWMVLCMGCLPLRIDLAGFLAARPVSTSASAAPGLER
jgi:hypothetical protein